jgi:peptidoglycan/xylan/chitin deacetylase (PgdA/CDA1 family)
MARWLPILTFHAIDEQESDISMSPGLFRRAMARLKASGGRAVALEEAAARVRQGLPFPRRAFVLTFDDGYESVYREAFPILQALGWPATVFLIAGSVSTFDDDARLPTWKERRMLSWGQVREMHRAGIAMGGHTQSHPHLTHLTEDEIAAELVGSKRAIEEALGSSIRSFAYPYGEYDPRCRAIASQHFGCAVTTAVDRITLQSDLYALPRVDTGYLRSEHWFEWLLQPSFVLYLQLRRPVQSLRAWTGRRRGSSSGS